MAGLAISVRSSSIICPPVASAVAFSNARRPYPLFNAINYADNGANMLYSGLQTQVQKGMCR